MVLRSLGCLSSSLGGDGVAMLLDEPEMEAEQGKKQRGERHDVQSEEALHGEFAYVGAAAQNVGHGGTDERDRGRDLQADLGGEVAELVHGQQVAGEAEDGGELIGRLLPGVFGHVLRRR